jgi:ADP-ribose pyrophosphatase YjhB (NUDIX family)
VTPGLTETSPGWGVPGGFVEPDELLELDELLEEVEPELDEALVLELEG